MIELSGAARRRRRHRESIELVCLLWYCSGAALSITGDFDIVPSVPKGILSFFEESFAPSPLPTPLPTIRDTIWRQQAFVLLSCFSSG